MRERGPSRACDAHSRMVALLSRPALPYTHSQTALEPVYNHVQPKPYYVNKMPIPGSALKGKMMCRRKVAFHHAVQHHCQHDRAHRHVKPMETCQHKEGLDVDA